MGRAAARGVWGAAAPPGNKLEAVFCQCLDSNIAAAFLGGISVVSMENTGNAV